MALATVAAMKDAVVLRWGATHARWSTSGLLLFCWCARCVPSCRGARQGANGVVLAVVWARRPRHGRALAMVSACVRAMRMHGMSRALGAGVPEQRARRRPLSSLCFAFPFGSTRGSWVLLCYRLAKLEQELVLRRGPFMASERLGVVVPVFPSR